MPLAPCLRDALPRLRDVRRREQGSDKQQVVGGRGFQVESTVYILFHNQSLKTGCALSSQGQAWTLAPPDREVRALCEDDGAVGQGGGPGR